MSEYTEHNHLQDILPGESFDGFIYPPDLFHMRLKEEILRSNRTHAPFLYIRIPTRHFDLFGFEHYQSSAVKAWKISVLTILTQAELVDIKGYLEDNSGIGVILLNARPELVQDLKKQILRNLRAAELLEKIKLKPREPLFQVYFYSGEIEEERQNTESEMEQFSHINEGFFSVENLNYSDLQKNQWNRVFVNVIKRLFDVTMASFALIVLSPLLLLVAAAVKISDPGGPAIFKQTRVGRNGRLFRILKFRTMYVNAEERLKELKSLNETDGPVFKIRKDPRIFPFGRFLRKYSVDELPQLINIIHGEMAIVGPRPPIAEEVQAYLPWHKMRLSVKPGLTCHWQVSGRSNLGFEEWMRLDNQYVRHGNLTEDMKLIGKTFKAVFRGDGAY